MNSLYHGNLCIFIYILLKHINRHNLTIQCHPQVKLNGKGSGRSFTCIPLCLNSGPFLEVQESPKWAIPVNHHTWEMLPLCSIGYININSGSSEGFSTFQTYVTCLSYLECTVGWNFFFGQQNPFLLKYTQNWSLSAHTGVVPVTGVQY